MPIKPSAAPEILPLIEALRGSDEARRETAVARLAVMGSRAVERLVTTYHDVPDRSTRIAVLRVLESAADRRALAVARHAVSEGGDVALAGTAVLRSLLDSPQGQVGAEALDTLMDVALTRSVERPTRIAACDALEGAPADVRRRVIAALQSDPDLEVTSKSGASRAGHPIEAVWRDALDGRFPENAGVIRRTIAARAGTAPLTTLQKLVDVLRAHEGATADPLARMEWQSVRGTLHQALARRGSRVALYDLRESLASASSPLPVSFLAAVHELGDGSCLEPLALAYTRVDDGWWRQQIGSAFRAIVKREKITRRHAVMKRIAARWPEAAFALMKL